MSVPLQMPSSHLLFCHGSCLDSSSIAASADEDRPPDSVLRFGDIPAIAFSAGTHSLVHLPLSVPVPVSPDMSPTGSSEAKLCDRSASPGPHLCNRNASPPGRGRSAGRDLDMLGGGDAFPAVAHEICCGDANASCMSTSPGLSDALPPFQRGFRSNEAEDEDEDEEEAWLGSDSWLPLDVYSCDDFRMYEFKVRKCVRGRSHDWTECPFAHPGEKARRRDPRRYRYSGAACPDFRKGNCRRGEACEFSHGVFECWLHPTRYRTQPCKDGTSCRRRICFFAHTPEQLRVVASECESPPATPRSGSSSSGSTRSSLLKAAVLSGEAYDGSPLRRALAGTFDGSLALELLLDDASSKSSPASSQHLHHWIGTGSPASTYEGLPAAGSSPSRMSSQMLPSASPLMSPPGSWMSVPAHRRHLDRLRSIPMISIPAAEDCCDSPPHRSPCTMAEFMSTLQSLQLSPGGMAVQSCRTVPSCSSAWPMLSTQKQLPSRSAPNTPKSRYLQGSGMQMERPSTVVSHLLRASSSEIVADSDVPDLDWVNELVQ